MFNINDWNLSDPQPGIELSEIKIASVRATALLIRNRERPILQTHLMHIFGAIEMMAGMEYHHDAFTRLHRRVARGSVTDELQLRHEAIAYLNRLGQFVAFSKSNLVRSVAKITVDDFPTMKSAMVFRDKHAAHRSIDAPRADDTPNLTQSHALALSKLFGSLLRPRPNKRRVDIARMPDPFDLSKFRQGIWRSSFLVFQLAVDEAGGHVDFSLEEQHPVIIGEAYRIVDRVIMTNKS